MKSLPSATVLLAQAWGIYKEKLGILLGIAAIQTSITLISRIFFTTSTIGSTAFIISFITGSIKTNILIGFISSIIIFILTIIFQSWGQVALIYAIKEKIGIVEAYRRSWHKILSYWWVTILTSIIIFGGIILFIIPGIIFSVWFSFAIFMLVIEEQKGMNALLKSREYVKGYWGRILWRSIFISIVTILIVLVANSLVGFLKIDYLTKIAGWAVGVFIAPLILTYSYLIYDTLKHIKGSLIFEPKVKQKANYIILGLLGIIIFIGIIAFALLRYCL